MAGGGAGGPRRAPLGESRAVTGAGRGGGAEREGGGGGGVLPSLTFYCRKPGRSSDVTGSPGHAPTPRRRPEREGVGEGSPRGFPYPPAGRTRAPSPLAPLCCRRAPCASHSPLPPPGPRGTGTATHTQRRGLTRRSRRFLPLFLPPSLRPSLPARASPRPRRGNSPPRRASCGRELFMPGGSRRRQRAPPPLEVGGGGNTRRRRVELAVAAPLFWPGPRGGGRGPGAALRPSAVRGGQLGLGGAPGVFGGGGGGRDPRGSALGFVLRLGWGPPSAEVLSFAEVPLSNGI